MEDTSHFLNLLLFVIDVFEQSSKTFFLEVWGLFAKFTNTAGLLFLWFRSGFAFPYRKNAIREDSSDEEVEVDEDNTGVKKVTPFGKLCDDSANESEFLDKIQDVSVLEQEDEDEEEKGSQEEEEMGEGEHKRPSTGLKMGVKPLKDQRMTRTTGFFEDLRLQILLNIERAFDPMRRVLNWFFQSSYTSIVVTIFITLPIALVLILFRFIYRLIFFWGDYKQKLESSVERQQVEDVVIKNGYPFERHEVVTKDGYVIRVDRLPNKKSSKVVYLQHGVFDNSFAWVSSGTQSLAYRLHDLGFDVWLGNLRGTTQVDKVHVNDRISTKEYWNFSLNEHAMYDFPAFFHRIKTTKRGETGKDNCKITIVSHSLGAAVTLMYLVFRKMGLVKAPITHPEEFKDNVVKAVLLSPAGVHIKFPKMIYILIPLIDLVLLFLPIHVFKAPSRTLGILVAKLWEDVRQTPTFKFILGLFTAMLLGGEIENHPVHHMNPQHTFEGTSSKMYRHFVQIWKKNAFMAYDFGEKKNITIYGSPHPPKMLPNYRLIDVPVHFVYGRTDGIIPSENVIKHYEALREHHPNLASITEFEDAGHLEFTLGLTDAHLSRIIDMIKK